MKKTPPPEFSFYIIRFKFIHSTALGIRASYVFGLRNYSWLAIYLCTPVPIPGRFFPDGQFQNIFPSDFVFFLNSTQWWIFYLNDWGGGVAA